MVVVYHRSDTPYHPILCPAYFLMSFPVPSAILFFLVQAWP